MAYLKAMIFFLNCILLLQLNTTLIKAIIPGTRVIAEIKQNIISKHIQVIRLNINFDEILRRMKRRGALDEAKFNEYKDPIDPEWHRILAFLYDVVNEFSWTQFLTFKNVLKKVNKNLFLVVFKDRECDETLLRCIRTPTH